VILIVQLVDRYRTARTVRQQPSLIPKGTQAMPDAKDLSISSGRCGRSHGRLRSVLPIIAFAQHTRLRLDSAWEASKTYDVIPIAPFAAPVRVKSNLCVEAIAVTVGAVENFTVHGVLENILWSGVISGPAR